MEQYPHIEGSTKAPIGEPCIAFYKYDGSNLRFEWSPKKGWHKFGTEKNFLTLAILCGLKPFPCF